MLPVSPKTGLLSSGTVHIRDQIIVCCAEVCVCEIFSSILGLYLLGVCSHLPVMTTKMSQTLSPGGKTSLATSLPPPYLSPTSSCAVPSLPGMLLMFPEDPPRPRGLCVVLVFCSWSASALSLPDFSFLTCALNKEFTGLVSPSFSLTAASSKTGIGNLFFCQGIFITSFSSHIKLST